MTQKKALEILASGANCLLTGEPGSGKSYTIGKFVDDCMARGKSVVITASTGIAATHVGGVTIHSWTGVGDLLHDIDLGCPIDDDRIRQVAEKPWIRNKISRMEVLVIDEVSMLSASLFDIFDRICRSARGMEDTPFGGLQVVLVGDLFQLPPVAKHKDVKVDFVFHAKAWKELELKKLVLTEQHRQSDGTFLDVLKGIRSGTSTQEHFDIIKARQIKPERKDLPRLFAKNRQIDAFNDAELKRLPGTQKNFGMEQSGKDALIAMLKRNCLSPEIFKVKEGAVVMFTKNDPDGFYVNGTLGVVIGYDKHTGDPIVRMYDGQEVTVEYAEWSVKEYDYSSRKYSVVAAIRQVPLCLAWAITVHKSQGMTLDAAIVDLSEAFEYGQGYVALSRIRSLEGLYVEGLNDHSFKVHPEIAAMDLEFISHSKSLE